MNLSVEDKIKMHKYHGIFFTINKQFYYFSMGESFQDYSRIHVFEADFP